MSKKEYDVVVVGGSLSGFLTALKAAQQGLRTAIVEENRIGGIKMLAADMPIQTLLNNDKILQECVRASQRGLSFTGAAFDPESFYKSIEDNANDFSKQLVDELKRNGVDVFIGNSTIKRDHTITIEREGTNPRSFTWDKLIYADEPVTKIPEVVKDNVKGYYTLENFGLLDTLPNGLIIYGYGERALQAATVWSGLGSQVYLVVPNPKILTGVPDAVVERYDNELRRRGVQIFSDYDIESIYQDSSGMFHVEIKNLKTDETRSILGSELMILNERESSNTGISTLNLDKDGDWIKTDEKLQTSFPGVYTWTGSTKRIGKANMAPETAEYLAEVVSGKETGPFEERSDRLLINLNPVYAAVGKTDPKELEDLDLRIGKVGKELSDGDYFEIIFDPEIGEIIGAQAIGKGAEDLISTVELLKNAESSVYDLEEVNLPVNSTLITLQEAINNAKH